MRLFVTDPQHGIAIIKACALPYTGKQRPSIASRSHPGSLNTVGLNKDVSLREEDAIFRNPL